MRRIILVWSSVLIFAFFVVVMAQSPTAKKVEQEREDQDLVAAIVSKQPKPERPRNYRGSKVNVTVVLKAIFRSSGKVTDIKVAKVIPEAISEELAQDLIKRSIKAAKRIKFIPATKDGHPV